MISEFQHLFVVPRNYRELSYKGTRIQEDKWLEGQLFTKEHDDLFLVHNGIPDFTDGSKTTWSGGGDEVTPTIDWIERNWLDHQEKMREHEDHDYYSFARRIAHDGGLVLDVASGPGGGAMPAILFFDSDAKILMSDLGPSVLDLWRQHLERTREGRNVSFVGMDATEMPLRRNSFDYVVDSGGFGNISHTDEALQEAYRILKPGGTLYLNDAITEGLDQFPPEVYRAIVEACPQDQNGWEHVIRDVGFSIVGTKTWSRRQIDYEESDLGALAKEHGVNIWFLGLSIIAVKPQ